MRTRFRHCTAWLLSLTLLAASAGIFAARTAVAQRPKTSLTPASSPAPAASPSPTPATTSSIAKPRPEYYSLPVGQTYVYAAMWRVFNAGTASLRMEQTGKEVRVTGSADAAGAAALLYKVQDHYESVLDPTTFCSQSTSRRIEEGFRRVDTNIAFEYARGKAVLDQKNIKKKESKHEEHTIPACVTDVLSAIYYVASLPLQPGSTYSFPLNDGGETIKVNVHAEAKEQIKTPAGTFQTIRVQPETTSGPLKDKGKIWIWYSDDAARVPVQARAHMYWGTLTFVLQRIDRK